MTIKAIDLKNLIVQATNIGMLAPEIIELAKPNHKGYLCDLFHVLIFIKWQDKTWAFHSL